MGPVVNPRIVPRVVIRNGFLFRIPILWDSVLGVESGVSAVGDLSLTSLADNDRVHGMETGQVPESSIAFAQRVHLFGALQWDGDFIQECLSTLRTGSILCFQFQICIVFFLLDEAGGVS